MFLLLNCQVCIYYSNCPSHKYMDWTSILRSHVVIYLIHLLGQITPSIFHSVLKPDLLLRFLKAFHILVNNWHLFCASLSLSITSAVVGLALVIIVTMARYPSILIIRKLWKNKGLLLTWPGNYTQYIWSHTVRLQGERERVRAWAWSSTFIKVEGGSLGFRVLTLYWWIWNIRMEV